MRNYQLKQYRLPRHVYKMCLSVVQCYEYNKRRIANSNTYITATKYRDMPSTSSGTGSPFERQACNMADLHSMVDAVDEALKGIPQEYRDGIMNKIVHDVPYPWYAHRNTWSRWRQLFLYRVAQNLFLID